MSVIEDLKKTVDTTPFFAAVGATDLAVEKVREARLRADKARADLAVRAEKARVELSTDLAPASVQARATKAVDDAKELPAIAINQTMVFGGKLTEAYDELAARGHKLVEQAPWGAVELITVGPTGRVVGVNDPRRPAGSAAGY